MAVNLHRTPSLSDAGWAHDGGGLGGDGLPLIIAHRALFMLQSPRRSPGMAVCTGKYHDSLWLAGSPKP